MKNTATTIDILFWTGDIPADGQLMEKRLRMRYEKVRERILTMLGNAVTVALRHGNQITIRGGERADTCRKLSTIPDIRILDEHWEREPVADFNKVLNEISSQSR